MKRVRIVVEKAKHNYSAYSPDLPGCVATGATRKEAERNIHEAIKVHLRELKEDYLFESDPKFIARIESLRRQYRREGGTKIEDVKKELGLPSRLRRKRG